MDKALARNRTFCDELACRVKVRGVIETVVLSYAVSAAVLTIPLLNALTAKVPNILPLWGLNINVTALTIAAVWIISGYMSSQERHTHIFSTLFGACGMPGALMALMALGKL